MQRARRGVNVPVPTTLLDYGDVLAQNTRYRQSYRGEDFYKAAVADDNGDVNLISENLSARLSTDVTHIHDGTRKVVPSPPPSSQLNSNVLMGRETELLYSRVFAYLKEVLPEWYPTDITCDFEKALRSAL
ncbi:hypothetical protein J6590_049753 [Homalodisca vitripennis]|nr:hypothetical protein J6590_049753 [Homalodisca vitripennis]